MTEKNSRLHFIDIAKGIGIILVVIGHTKTYLGIENFIYQFHMPLFFILSGFFYTNKSEERISSFFLKKVKGLYIPYVRYGIILLTFFCIISLVTIGTISYSFLGISKVIVFLCLYIGNVPLGGALWFLRSLFIISMSFFILNSALRLLGISRHKNIALLSIAIIFLFIGYRTSLPYNISSSFVAFFFYYIGYIYRTYNHLIRMHIVLAIIGFIIVLLSSMINKVDMAYNTYTYISPFIISSLSGTYVIIYISHRINNSEVLEYIGKKSLAIMALHFLAFKFVNLIIIQAYNLPISRINDYPTIKEFHYWWIAYSIVGVVVSLGFDYIISRIKILHTDYWRKIFKISSYHQPKA